MAMSIREMIDTIESLQVGDTVKFTDDTGVEHHGEVVELQRHDNHRDWLIKTTSDTPDNVLELWFDPEGGPTDIQVSFESQESRNVTELEQTN